MGPEGKAPWMKRSGTRRVKAASGQSESILTHPPRACFINNGNFALFDGELLTDFEKAAFGGGIGVAPPAVGLRCRTIAQGGGNNDRVFVDVESEPEFGIHGVF